MFEISGIETIARGVTVKNGAILLCMAKGAKTSYLPGGHIEFGETGREALEREIREELGVTAKAGKFLGVVENSFMQQGERHCEINLVYEMDSESFTGAPLESAEGWIEFRWMPLDQLDAAGLLPEVFRRLGTDPAASFAP